MKMDTQPLTQTDQSAMLDSGIEAPPIVRFDERRMHVRAYNYWASLLKGRSLPSIEDLEPADIEDFGSHSILLDFTSGVEDPSIAFVGSALRDQCALDHWVDRISLVPARTLISRLTDHYLQIIANEAPISFEAEFVNQRNCELLYRGIMMPFSSDGETIDFIYGVINWKEVANSDLTRAIAEEVNALSPLPQLRPLPVTRRTEGMPWPEIAISSSSEAEDDGAPDMKLDVMNEPDDVLDLTTRAEAAGADGSAGPAMDMLDLSADDMIGDAATTLATDPDASLADRLSAARDAAQSVTASEGRTHAALYRALDLCHAFALAAQARREDYVSLLIDAGLTESVRSPTTALVKLIFGGTYDKTRIAEYACVIDHAQAQDLPAGTLADVLARSSGGLKGLVRSIRAARKGEAGPAPTRPMTGLRSATRKLAKARPLDLDAVITGEDGLGVVIVRREADGTLAMVASLETGSRLTERVIVSTRRKG
jgi:hypothetical protein